MLILWPTSLYTSFEKRRNPHRLILSLPQPRVKRPEANERFVIKERCRSVRALSVSMFPLPVTILGLLQPLPHRFTRVLTYSEWLLAGPAAVASATWGNTSALCSPAIPPPLPKRRLATPLASQSDLTAAPRSAPLPFPFNLVWRPLEDNLLLSRSRAEGKRS